MPNRSEGIRDYSSGRHGELLGEIQDEKYFRPETGYWINDQGKIWIRTGRIINSNNRLHKESTEKFEINLIAWLREQELIRKPIVEEKDFSMPKQRLMRLTEEKDEAQKEWMLAER